MIGDKLIKTAGTNNEQYSGPGMEGVATQATTLGYSSFYQGGDYGKEIKPDGKNKRPNSVPSRVAMATNDACPRVQELIISNLCRQSGCSLLAQQAAE